MATTPTTPPAKPKRLRTVYGDMLDLSNGRKYTLEPQAFEDTLWVQAQVSAGKAVIE